MSDRFNGVKVSKTNLQVMRISARTILGVDPRGKTQQDLIKLLTEYFTQDTNNNIGCDTCEGWSNKELKGCPFCGEADVVPDASVSFDEGESAAASPEPIVSIVKRQPAALKPTVSKARVVAWIKEVKEIQGESMMAFWKMGQMLVQARDENLWRLMTDAKGEPMYSNFNNFVRGELDIAPKQTQDMMVVATTFEMTVATKYSRAITTMALNMKPAERSEIFDALKSGMDEDEVRAKWHRDQRPRSASPQHQPEIVNERDKLLTLVMKPGRQKVKLFASTDEDKRAKRIGDRPKGTLECERGQLVFEVALDEAGNMELIVKALPPTR